jgi:hypothetical protein
MCSAYGEGAFVYDALKPPCHLGAWSPDWVGRLRNECLLIPFGLLSNGWVASPNMSLLRVG